MSTWAPLPLADIGSASEKTTILERVDGHHLLYPGRIHVLRGESESHKTWIALSAVAEILTGDGRVAYVDFEDHATTIVIRLLALGVARTVIDDPDRFVYFRPEESVDGPQPWQDLYAALDAAPVHLVVLDGVTESMTLEGLDLNSNRDVATWIGLLPRPIADRIEGAVLAIDHVTKASESRGNYAIGAQHKRAGVDVQYAVAVIHPLAPVTIGLDPRHAVILLTIDKDRPGYVRSISHDGKQAGTVEMTAWPDGNITWRITTAELSNDHGLRKRIADLLRGAPGAPKRMLRELGNSNAIDQAIGGMIEDQHVTVDITGTAHKHFLTDLGEEAYR